jgi:hypothetical protein
LPLIRSYGPCEVAPVNNELKYERDPVVVFEADNAADPDIIF